MTEPGEQEQRADIDDHEVSDRILTVPNLLCLIRLGGSFVLIPLALQNQNEVFLWLFVFLAMTDWVDGKLAILLNQRTVLGAMLDSWADAVLYTALFFGVMILYDDRLQDELVWIGAAVLSYLVSTAAGIWKYRRWPSYHTRAAKTSWFLTAVAVIGLFFEWSLWPLRVAAVAVTVTNIEALTITIVSPKWRSDVVSIYHAMRDREAA